MNHCEKCGSESRRKGDHLCERPKPVQAIAVQNPDPFEQWHAETFIPFGGTFEILWSYAKDGKRDAARKTLKELRRVAFVAGLDAGNRQSWAAYRIAKRVQSLLDNSLIPEADRDALWCLCRVILGEQS